MKRALVRLALVGASAGAAVALVGYLRRAGLSGQEAARVTFDDGSDLILSAGSPDGVEFTNIAHKLIEIGV
jgi:hypothetical protein